MKFSTAAFIAGLATTVSAKAAFTNNDFIIEQGKPFTIKWSDVDGKGPYTVNLQTGPSTNLQTVKTVGTTKESQIIFTPDSALPSGVYVFEIIDSTKVPNYSVQWTYQGSASAPSTGLTSSLSALNTLMSSVTLSAAQSSSTISSNSTLSASATDSINAIKTFGNTSTQSAAATPPGNSNSGVRAASPLALLLVTVVAVVFFN